MRRSVRLLVAVLPVVTVACRPAAERHAGAEVASSPAAAVARDDLPRLAPEACTRWPVANLLDVLGRDGDVPQAVAACVVRHAARFGSILVRAAVERVATGAAVAPLLDLSRVLAGELRAASADGTTRALCAAAIGAVVAGRRAVVPRWRVPAAVLGRLEDCITLPETPPVARDACVRAVADGGILELVPVLERQLASGAGPARLVAARALGRLTGVGYPRPALAADARLDQAPLLARSAP